MLPRRFKGEEMSEISTYWSAGSTPTEWSSYVPPEHQTKRRPLVALMEGWSPPLSGEHCCSYLVLEAELQAYSELSTVAGQKIRPKE